MWLFLVAKLSWAPALRCRTGHLFLASWVGNPHFPAFSKCPTQRTVRPEVRKWQNSPIKWIELSQRPFPRLGVVNHSVCRGEGLRCLCTICHHFKAVGGGWESRSVCVCVCMCWWGGDSSRWLMVNLKGTRSGTSGPGLFVGVAWRCGQEVCLSFGAFSRWDGGFHFIFPSEKKKLRIWLGLGHSPWGLWQPGPLVTWGPDAQPQIQEPLKPNLQLLRSTAGTFSDSRSRLAMSRWRAALLDTHQTRKTHTLTTNHTLTSLSGRFCDVSKWSGKTLKTFPAVTVKSSNKITH